MSSYPIVFFRLMHAKIIQIVGKRKCSGSFNKSEMPGVKILQSFNKMVINAKVCYKTHKKRQNYVMI